MTSPPLVSVIMPAYNSQAYIQAAIDSVLTQRYTNIELIVIDDASTDETASIVQSISDDRVVFIAAAHQGKPSAVRNIGLMRATGEFITFLDSDDIMQPDALVHGVEGLNTHSDWLAITGFFRHVDESLNPIRGKLDLASQNGTFTFPKGYEHSLLALLKKRTIHGLPALMMRKAVPEQIGLLNEHLGFSEDYEYFLRIATLGFEKLGSAPYYTCAYRYHLGSHTHRPDIAQNWLNTNLSILKWVSEQPNLAKTYQQHRAEIIATRYYDTCLWQLGLGDKIAVLQILQQAIQDPALPQDYWIQLMPIMFRLMAPKVLIRFLKQVAKHF